MTQCFLTLQERGVLTHFFIGSRCERSGILRWLVSMSVYHLMWVPDLVRLKYDQAVMDGLTFSMTAGHQALYSI